MIPSNRLASEMISNQQFDHDPQLYGKLLMTAMKEMREQAFQTLLIRNLSNYRNIIAAMRIMEKCDQQAMINHLLLMSIKAYNIALLHKLKEMDENYFNQLLAEMDSERQQAAARYLSVKDEKYCEYIADNMYDFAFERGGVSYEGGLLTCAQIKSRKSTYHFNPVILDQKEEFVNFLKAIKQYNKPLAEKFIVTGGHWISGVIRINANGRADILLMDPCGPGDRLILTFIAKHLPKLFPDFRIYIAEEKRQHDFCSCQTFALDDVQHLFTLEKYLIMDNKSVSMFDYIEAQQKAEMNFANWKVKVRLVRLPLTFMRTMQSKDLFNKIIPSWPPNELSLAVNKKGQLTANLAMTFFQPESGKPKKLCNVRIKKKFDNMADNNLHFLLSKDKDSVEKLKKEFTLQCFINKLQNQDHRNCKGYAFR